MDGEEDSADLQGGGPVVCREVSCVSFCIWKYLGVRLTLEDVEADATQLVDVGVVDLGKEADLGRGHGVVIREEEFELEDATCVGLLAIMYMFLGTF